MTTPTPSIWTIGDADESPDHPYAHGAADDEFAARVAALRAARHPLLTGRIHTLVIDIDGDTAAVVRPARNADGSVDEIELHRLAVRLLLEAISVPLTGRLGELVSPPLPRLRQLGPYR